MPNMPKTNNTADILIQVMGKTSSKRFLKKALENKLPDKSRQKIVTLNTNTPLKNIEVRPSKQMLCSTKLIPMKFVVLSTLCCNADVCRLLTDMIYYHILPV